MPTTITLEPRQRAPFVCDLDFLLGLCATLEERNELSVFYRGVESTPGMTVSSYVCQSDGGNLNYTIHNTS